MADLKGKKIGFAVCGSFCTFSKAFAELEKLAASGAEVTAIMSFNAASTDTRFGKAAEHIARLEKATGRKIIGTIEEAEPIGPKKMFDALLIAPCTGNTMAKLAAGMTDTAVVPLRKPSAAETFPRKKYRSLVRLRYNALYSLSKSILINSESASAIISAEFSPFVTITPKGGAFGTSAFLSNSETKVSAMDKTSLTDTMPPFPS